MRNAIYIYCTNRRKVPSLEINKSLAHFACSLRKLRTLRITGGIQVYSVAGGMQVYSVAGGMQVYSVAGGVQVYSVSNYSTCCSSLHLQQSQNYIKELSWTQHSNTAYLNNRQTTIVI